MGLFDTKISIPSSMPSGSISLPSISIPSLSIPSSYSIPSYGSLPSSPSLGTIDSITQTLNGTLSSIIPVGMPKPIGELQAGTIGNLTQFQQDFNTQLTSLSTKLQQSVKPFLDKITDFGALAELLSNPETIIIIVAVVAALAVAGYLVYKFYWKKITYGESVADKYTEKGLEAAKIFK